MTTLAYIVGGTLLGALLAAAGILAAIELFDGALAQRYADQTGFRKGK